MRRRSIPALFARVLNAFAITGALAGAAPAADFARSGGPYVPTPQAVVDEMLALAGVTGDDFVIDLGSGDGRIVLTAASRFHAHGEGVEIDPELVERSTREAQERGLAHLARFVREDVLQARIQHASVLTLYLLPGMMHELRDRIYKELRPGARVVSHDFRFDEWPPDRDVTMGVTEKYGSSGNWQSTIYLWIVPAKVAGRWSASVGGGNRERYVFSFAQKFQRLEGEALVNGERIAIEGGKIEGRRLRFRLPARAGASVQEFSALVDGESMSGTVFSQAGSVPWQATRPAPAALR